MVSICRDVEKIAAGPSATFSNVAVDQDFKNHIDYSGPYFSTMVRY